MDAIDIRLQGVLNRLAEIYAQDLFRRARAVLSQGRMRASDELLNSVQVKWLKATDKYPPRILFIFAEHGIFLDQRSPKWVKVPNVENMKKWMDAKNIPLNRIPGYKNGQAPNLSLEKKKERIAWAIAWDKRKNDTWKRKRWKKETLSEMLKKMNVEVMQAFANECAQILADTIENKLVV